MRKRSAAGSDFGWRGACRNSTGVSLAKPPETFLSQPSVSTIPVSYFRGLHVLFLSGLDSHAGDILTQRISFLGASIK